MARYAWTITGDKINRGASALNGNETGKYGPHDVAQAEIFLAKSQGERFRLLDDDGEHYFTGRIIGLDGSDFEGFEPLDDFGMPSYGCTTIEYRDKAGKWCAI